MISSANSQPIYRNTRDTPSKRTEETHRANDLIFFFFRLASSVTEFIMDTYRVREDDLGKKKLSDFYQISPELHQVDSTLVERN
jgi:hypothetical protein